MSCHLEISSLYFSYAKQPVFTGLQFELTQPGIVGLLGLNGQGKSTLLKIIAGLLPVSCNIKCRNKPNSAANPIGFLPERPLFYPELRVRENVLFMARINGVDSHKLNLQTTQAMQMCQLSGKSMQLAGNLSKGYQQRLGLAMAIVHQPALLLLDEPTDGLDPQQIAEFHKLIARLAKNCSVIISSHRLEEISQLSDRLLILHNGKLACDTDIHDHQQLDNIRQLFSQITSDTVV